MKPWNRRLKDLSLLLNNCGKTYFEPELFRMNANQFLQTSRTVTFLIQKNKNSIPFFDSWYLNTVVNTWSYDVVMTWAKDSRNKIEKQGDINYFSTPIVTLVISYFHREDISIIPKEDRDALWLNINKLIKFVKPKMTEEAYDNSVLRIERKWVANSLPSWELLQVGIICKFVVIDDSSPSGHLTEIEICRVNRWATIMLRENSAGASWMSAGASIASNGHVLGAQQRMKHLQN
jgi:hypothetical protein